ncbi:hypothetical protein [Cohnella rhizosphaerae]|uniref:Uncharacterized protein n=1 Tax=Cohnella rhizosphaerae TaxID=1457232 RepID=A0A9X4KYL5_9BACL|nr:hypothetical protein [Cohnella rhizosphaerae]MDG0813302.1 hypothetical protein [Cohnella rhizosphaerae]
MNARRTASPFRHGRTNAPRISRWNERQYSGSSTTSVPSSHSRSGLGDRHWRRRTPASGR